VKPLPGGPIPRCTGSQRQIAIIEPLLGTDGRKESWAGIRRAKGLREKGADLQHLRCSVAIEGVRWIRAIGSVIQDDGLSIPGERRDGPKGLPRRLPEKPDRLELQENRVADLDETHC
jgi:hypothetical protein